MNPRQAPLTALTLALVLSGCSRPAPPPERPSEPAAPIDRVDVSEPVRRGLGMTFALVERRAVTRTLRVPGRFELPPDARVERRSPASGVVEIAVERFQRVERGQTLYRLDSAQWRDLQQQLAAAREAALLAGAAVESIGPFLHAHDQHHAEIHLAVDLWTERVASLEALRDAGGARADDLAQARAALASARAAFAETLEKEAELHVRQREAAAALEAAEVRWAILLNAAASLSGEPPARLIDAVDGRPRWESMQWIEVRAADDSVVEAVHAASGERVDAHAPVVTTVRPDRLRFIARALQSDIMRLSDGQRAAVVSADAADAGAIPGAIAIAPAADADRRTIDLLWTPLPDAPRPAWARAGLAAFLEVVFDGGDPLDLAIPLRAVARDGGRPVVFRRDPADPDSAIRVEPDLGPDDGRWIVVRSGLHWGDQVALDGAHQLMLAASAGAAKGGHFHPDGSFHDDEH